MSSRRIKLTDKCESDTLYRVTGIDKSGDDTIVGIIRVEIAVQCH